MVSCRGMYRKPFEDAGTLIACLTMTCIVTENTLSLVSDIAVLKIASLRYFYIRVSWAGNLSTDVLKRFSVTIQSCHTAFFSTTAFETSKSVFSVHSPA